MFKQKNTCGATQAIEQLFWRFLIYLLIVLCFYVSFVLGGLILFIFMLLFMRERKSQLHYKNQESSADVWANEIAFATCSKENFLSLKGNTYFNHLQPSMTDEGVTVAALIEKALHHGGFCVFMLQQKQYYFLAKKINEDHFAVCMLPLLQANSPKMLTKNSHMVIGLIFIDNYEEVTESIDEVTLPLLNAVIDRKINGMASSIQGVVRKYEKDKYFFVLTNNGMAQLKEKKFEILNEIREISIGNHIPVTLSIGLGVNQELDQAMKSARAAIDLALGRGGDQALIKEGEEYLFFGGKSSEKAHNARIRARVKADALSEIMRESSHIFAMGHQEGDIDCLGACLGIYRIAKTLKKECHIIINGVSDGIQQLYSQLMQQPEYKQLFLSEQEALPILDEKTVVAVLDTHRASLVEAPSMLKKAKKIVVFDHHRKSADFIESPVLIYHEPYASSASELVTEMIQYINEKVKLTALEADALLAGITLDTKNFCLKTGAITFESAAFLKRAGADSVRVRKLFQQDIAAYQAVSYMVSAADITENHIAIAICPENTDTPVIASAQAADDLLNIAGIKASFVLCQMGNTIRISARSFGEINVQVILEKLGGGGHQTMSGAQLADVTMAEAKEKLLWVIQQYRLEER